MNSSYLLHFLEKILDELQAALALIGKIMEQVGEVQKLNAGENNPVAANEEELQARIGNLLNLQRQIQEQYDFLKKEEPAPSIDPTNDRNDPFLLKVRSLFEDRMADPTFSLAELSDALNLSRSQLGRKIKAITGRTPALYLRSLRLRKARELLSSSNLSIKEIAYAVGFTHPAYFTKVYTREFGALPSQMRK